jgi:hypothetical protein
MKLPKSELAIVLLGLIALAGLWFLAFRAVSERWKPEERSVSDEPALSAPQPDETAAPAEAPEAPAEAPEAAVEVPASPAEVPEAPAESAEAPAEIPEAGPSETP